VTFAAADGKTRPTMHTRGGAVAERAVPYGHRRMINFIQTPYYRLMHRAVSSA
jgi:hypothetical protein